MKLIKINLAKIRYYNFAKHHIVTGSQLDKIKEVANDVLGLHAARLSSPYIALIPRMNNFKTNHLHSEVFERNNLIKLRCMRRTLHIVPPALVPIVHQATASLRIQDCLIAYRRENFENKDVVKLKDSILEFLSRNPLDSGTVSKIVSIKTKKNKTLVKIVLKHLWEEGKVCYINMSKCWQQEKRIFALTEERYPDLDFNCISENDAQRLLILNHIQQFGPVTIKDISWWSGISIKIVRETLKAFVKKIIEVKLEGDNGNYFTTKESFNEIHSLKIPQLDWITFLAYEDPSLKGYYESRFRYVSPKHYNKLFNQIGEARASIILNGQVVGVWTLNKVKNKIEFNLFEKLKKSQLQRLLKEKERFEKCFT